MKSRDKRSSVAGTTCGKARACADARCGLQEIEAAGARACRSVNGSYCSPIHLQATPTRLWQLPGVCGYNLRMTCGKDYDFRVAAEHTIQCVSESGRKNGGQQIYVQLHRALRVEAINVNGTTAAIIAGLQ